MLHNCGRYLTYIVFSQTGRAHLLLISHTPGVRDGAIGVITLEGCLVFYGSANVLIYSDLDIIEEIISEEIVDETDRYEDNQSKRHAKRMSTAAIMRGFVIPLYFHAHELKQYSRTGSLSANGVGRTLYHLLGSVLPLSMSEVFLRKVTTVAFSANRLQNNVRKTLLFSGLMLPRVNTNFFICYRINACFR